MVECGQTGGCGAGCTLGLGILLLGSLGIPPKALALGDRFILSKNMGLLFSVFEDFGKVGNSSRRDADLLLEVQKISILFGVSVEYLRFINVDN